MYKIWRPPFCGGPVPMAPMAPIDEQALGGWWVGYWINLWLKMLWEFYYWLNSFFCLSCYKEHQYGKKYRKLKTLFCKQVLIKYGLKKPFTFHMQHVLDPSTYCFVGQFVAQLICQLVSRSGEIYKNFKIGFVNVDIVRP